MSAWTLMDSCQLQVGSARASHFVDAETCEFPSLSMVPFKISLLWFDILGQGSLFDLGKLSAKYQFCTIHTADNTDGKVTGGGTNFTAGRNLSRQRDQNEQLQHLCLYHLFTRLASFIHPSSKIDAPVLKYDCPSQGRGDGSLAKALFPGLESKWSNSMTFQVF